MSDHEHITEDGLLQSIERLESLAKSQIVQGGNSEPGSWAGTSSAKSPENKNNMPNGTDYRTGGRKSIGELEAELALAKAKQAKDDDENAYEEEVAGMEKALCPACAGSGCGTCLNKGVVLVADDPSAFAKSDDYAYGIEKSFNEFAAADADIQEGYNVSSFLRGLGDVIGKSLASMEVRLGQRIDLHADYVSTGNGVIAKGLADLSRAALPGEHYVEAARAPKGLPAGGIATIEKSFANGGMEEETLGHPATLNTVQKSLVLSRMGEMVEKGAIDPLAVIRYETTGALDEEVFKSVMSDIGSEIQKAGVIAA